MTAVLATPPFIEFMDDDGNPLAGGLIYTYAAGSLVPKATYTDASGLIESPNPIVLDASGRAVWFIQGAYKYIVKDALGNTIKTVDNVISFNTLADAANAFFQSFSGNAVQTAFTLSTDLGTDSKNLMIFQDRGLEQSVANGSFATDTIWVKGAGWSIGAGVATAAGAISTAISQTSLVTLVSGQAYVVTYDITRSAGGLIPSIGGQNGTERTATGTYREVIVAGTSQTLAFTGNAFTGTLDNVSVTVADTAGYNIVNPAAYTVNGTALTFATPPAAGTNNIYVFAPSTLLGAASAAAALAQSYATAAAASADAAAASAAQAALATKWRPVVVAATTGNITLSGAQTIDGVGVIAGNRVLVKNQTNPAENGVYVAAGGTWTRATDADTWNEISGQAVTATAGTVNGNLSFSNTNDPGGILGTDPITWTQLIFYSTPADGSITLAKMASSALASGYGDYSSKLVSSTIMANSMLGGYINKFRNPSFDINQRGTTITVTAGVPAYTSDGWIIGATSANATSVVTPNGSGPDFSRLGITGNAGMTDTYLQQRIESYLAARLSGYSNTFPQVVCVQLNLSNVTGATLTPTLTVKYPNSQDDFSGAKTTVVNAVNLQPVANLASATVAYNFLMPAAACNGVEVTFDFGAALNANTKSVVINFADIRVLNDDNNTATIIVAGLNNSPPSPELRPYHTELIFCQRYLPGVASINTNSYIGPAYVGGGGNTLIGQVIFPVTARKTPTGIVASAAANFSGSQNSGSFVGSAIALGSNTSQSGCQVNLTVAGMTAGQGASFYFNANASSLLFTGAEL